MQRIGLIGSDNSHVARCTEILNLEGHPAYWPDSGATVHAIWGDDAALTAEEAEKGRIPVVASSPEEVAETCDLVFATSRRPGVHVAHASPAIEARKPLFVIHQCLEKMLRHHPLVTFAHRNRLSGLHKTPCPLGELRQVHRSLLFKRSSCGTLLEA